MDECHRSGFGDWFGVLEHFGGALQLGLTATPRELEEGERPLTDEEKRRDTQYYFGDPVFTYSLKQAIEDGYLVPYLLEERRYERRRGRFYRSRRQALHHSKF